MGRSKAAARKAKKAATAAAATQALATPAQLFKDAGNKAFAEQQYDRAVAAYSEGLKLEPGNISLLSNRSAAFAALHQYTAALDDAQAAIALEPRMAKLHLRRGDALEGLIEYGKAVEAYRAGLALDPEHAALKAAVEKLESLQLELTQTEAKENEGRGGNPEDDKFAVMVRWLRKGGGRHPMLFMRYYSEDYRGVHALTKVPPETVVLYVPKSHIMTSGVAHASPIGRKLLDGHVDLRSKHSYLACYLLEEREKGEQSFWWPYINMLPTKYRNVPINFDEDEMKWLAGSFTLAKIDERKTSLRAEYENICRHIPEFERHGLDAFIWARLVVITRIFGLHIDGEKTDGLVPYADMLNHKRPRETKWTYDQSMEGFTITSCKTLHSGAEVFDSYGRKCNSRYFVNYGFSLAENEDNEAVLRVALPKMDPHYTLKLKMLGGVESNAAREYQVPCAYAESKKTREVFSFLRLCHARDSELVMIPPPSRSNPELKVDPLSVRNEIEVLEHAARSADMALEGFDRTMEEHEELLKDESIPEYSNVRNALLMVRGEQRVLHAFKKMAETCVPMLKMQWKDLKKEAAKNYGTDLSRYIREVVVPLVKRGS